MDRRIGGIVVIAVAVLAVLVVLPAVGGRGTPGVAVRSPAPVVGDCLTGMTPTTPQQITVDATTGKIQGFDLSDEVDLPSGALGDCSADGAGRAVAAGDDAPPSAHLSRVEYLAAVSRRCGAAAQLISEALAEAGDHVWHDGDRTIGYRPVFDGTLEPTLVGRVDPGRPWWACYLRVRSFSHPPPAGTPVAERIDPARPPAALLQCLSPDTDGAGTAGRVPCDQPHVGQVLGMAYMFGGRLRPADYADACTDYAAALTGMTDPTAGGALTVVPASQGSDPTCALAVTDPARTLSGSLIGVDDGPLPWSG